jgi:hypothetical protein
MEGLRGFLASNYFPLSPTKNCELLASLENVNYELNETSSDQEKCAYFEGDVCLYFYTDSDC